MRRVWARIRRSWAAADYRALPRVTFTDPEIGAVGLTEVQARKDGIPVATGTAQAPTSARGWIHKAGNDGFIKLVTDAERGVLVVATSAGPVGVRPDPRASRPWSLGATHGATRPRTP